MPDWDNRAGTADTAFAGRILAAAAAEGPAAVRMLETPAHAGHLTTAPCIKTTTGAPIGIGEQIAEPQRLCRPVFDARDPSRRAAMATACSATASTSRWAG